jgi:hypothetical protein
VARSEKVVGKYINLEMINVLGRQSSTDHFIQPTQTSSITYTEPPTNKNLAS